MIMNEGLHGNVVLFCWIDIRRLLDIVKDTHQ